MSNRISAMLFIAAAGAIGLWGCASDPETVIMQGTAIEHGKALFYDQAIPGTVPSGYSCATCHDAENGSGNILRPGAALAGVTKRASYWGGQEVELLRAINQCLYYFMLEDRPWTPEDTDAQAIFAYLESISGEGTDTKEQPFTVVRDIVDMQAGDSARGAKVFDRACAFCHGAPKTGKGKSVAKAPSLPDATLAAHPPDKYSDLDRRLVFVEKTRHGGFLGYGGQMPPFSLEKLSDADMAEVLAFLGLY